MGVRGQGALISVFLGRWPRWRVTREGAPPACEASVLDIVCDSYSISISIGGRSSQTGCRGEGASVYGRKKGAIIGHLG